MDNSLLEKLSSLEHEQWCCWAKYMLDNYSEENILRWRKQIQTNYKNLSEKEKLSDKKWARRVLEIISDHEKY